ncbi:MAG: aminotransferase class I/II-fold pyridoxal phosphate-dependent enzyme [Chromatiales bacterium]|jgi:histidinol-phosphate aminotransferase|nr:aminotransferase class I/II-fold pyridoxal phosphate-dependent enzyme [Chromatiales bacterium]
MILPHEVGAMIHRMDLNECPYPPSPHVVEALADAVQNLNRYPDGTLPSLTPRLAERLGIPEGQICYGAGSTQLLTAIAQIAVDAGGQLIAPSLLWRRFAGVFNIVDAELVSVANQADGAIDVEGLLGALSNQSQLLLVLTPNNPTGLMLNSDELRHLATETPENVLLFVDEAYFEFAQYAGGADAVEILKQRKGPWVVTRTFSKAYALAGLRLGYAICSSLEVANALRLVTSTFNLVGIAEAAAMAALDDPDYTKMILATTEVERNRIRDGFRALGIEPMASVTNFISADIGMDAGTMVKAMRERGIRIATFGDPAYPTLIRVSTGFPEDTDAFLTALKEIKTTDHA